MIARRLSGLTPNSIFERLQLLLAAVFALGAIIALAAAWIFSSAAATDAYDRLLVSAATQISEAITVEKGKFDVLPPDSAFETLAQAEDDRFFFAVRAPDGMLLTGDTALQAADEKAPDEVPTLGYIRDRGDTMRTVTIHRLIASPDAKGWCSVIVAQSLHARYRLIVHLMLRIGLSVMFVSALGFAASLAAVRRALRPFGRIAHALAMRQAQDTGPLTVDSPAETQTLVETINSAFVRLDERMTRLQRFAGMAAHQIRTPLAALGAQTELILAETTKQGRRGRVERIRTHVAKLSRLTNQLLGQAMVSYRTDRIPHEEIELVALVRLALHDAVPESLDRDLAVEFEPTESTVGVWGDNVTLREALLNLISNAVNHGATTLLRVGVDADQSFAYVHVADDGPGIACELWDVAIQPFQIPRTAGDGAGMGLSIAAEVAKAHGGTIKFGRTADNLFQIIFSLKRSLRRELGS